MTPNLSNVPSITIVGTAPTEPATQAEIEQAANRARIQDPSGTVFCAAEAVEITRRIVGHNRVFAFGSLAA